MGEAGAGEPAPAALLHFEDFTPGDVAEYGAYRVSRDEIVAFASEFDPQPFHLDEAAAQATLLRGLSASGWHTCGMMMRINCDGFLLGAAGLGAPGIDEVKWLKPVRPGDVLHVRRTIRDARASRSRTDMGLVDFLFECLNQDGAVVMTQRNWVMFRRRGAAAAAAVQRPGDPPAPAGDRVAAAHGGFAHLPMFDDLAVGAAAALGEYTFTREAIVRFARAYDPQPFHVDEAAARRGPFGGLAASGWHTAAAWMRTYLDWFQRRAEVTAGLGLPVPAIGPSPGFRDLQWLRPVRAGDRIAFSMEVIDTRPSRSHPGWGVLTSRHRGVDQTGTPVFAFTVASFWERRR